MRCGHKQILNIANIYFVTPKNIWNNKCLSLNISIYFVTEPQVINHLSAVQVFKTPFLKAKVGPNVCDHELKPF